MSERRPNDRDAERFQNSPIAWFGELILAKDRGNFRRAAEAQSELTRLGWTVQYREGRPDRQGGGR